MRTFILAAALALAVATPLAAQTMPQVDAGVSFGTLGVGPEVNLRYANVPVGIRVGFNALNFGSTAHIGSSPFKVNLQMASAGTTVDYYPFDNGLRLSGGLRYGATDVRLSATIGGSVKVGNTTYSSSNVGTLTGRDTFNAVSPFFGLGYQTTFFGGAMPVALDLGAVYQGTGNVNVGATGLLATNPIFHNDLINETAKIQHKLNYPLYPVIQVSMAYRF